MGSQGRATCPPRTSPRRRSQRPAVRRTAGQFFASMSLAPTSLCLHVAASPVTIRARVHRWRRMCNGSLQSPSNLLQRQRLSRRPPCRTPRHSHATLSLAHRRRYRVCNGNSTLEDPSDPHRRSPRAWSISAVQTTTSMLSRRGTASRNSSSRPRCAVLVRRSAMAWSIEAELLIEKAETIEHHGFDCMAGGHNPHFRVLRGGLINDVSDAEFCKPLPCVRSCTALSISRRWKGF